ncbi:hypothetical protein ABPG74_000094 [Tetrahymena malaccensis]
MNKVFFLTFVGVSVLLSGAALLTQFNLDDKSEQLLSSGNLVTVRKWNDCVSANVGIACNDAPNKVHPHCYNTLVYTNNCLLLTPPESCNKFNNFYYNSTNIDSLLPQEFLDCVQDCDTYASQDTYFYRWYNKKYRNCSVDN